MYHFSKDHISNDNFLEVRVTLRGKLGLNGRSKVLVFCAEASLSDKFDSKMKVDGDDVVVQFSYPPGGTS